MTVAEAAKELGLSQQRIRQRIAAGDMLAERVGARVLLIPREEVERWKKIGRLPAGRPKKGNLDA